MFDLENAFNPANIIKSHFKSLGKNPMRDFLLAVIAAGIILAITRPVNFNVTMFFMTINIAFSFILANFYFLIRFFSMGYDDEEEEYYWDDEELKAQKKADIFRRERRKFRKEVSVELGHNLAFANMVVITNIIIIMIFSADYFFPLITSFDISNFLESYKIPFLIAKYTLNYFIYFLSLTFLFTLKPILRRAMLLFAF
jgi:energy-coupling factor transporter transmembrane protein EcfT